MIFLGMVNGLQIVDDEGKPTRTWQDRPKPAPKATPADKPLDAPTTKTEVQRALCVVYNLAHKVLRDDVRYIASDFSEEADGLIELLNQHGVLRIALRIIAPLAMVGAIIEKVEGTISRWRDRKARRQMVDEQEATSPNAPIIVATAGNGLTPEQIKARPFLR